MMAFNAREKLGALLAFYLASLWTGCRYWCAQCGTELVRYAGRLPRCPRCGHRERAA